MVVMVVNQLGGGGAQRSAIQLASSWPATGGSCAIVAAKDGPYRRSIDKSVPVHILAPDWPKVLAIVLFVLRFRRFVRESDTTIIVTHLFGMSHLLLALRALRLVSQPVIVVERNHFTSEVSARFSAPARAAIILLTRHLYRRAESIIAISSGVARDLERTLRIPAVTVTMIPNPIDVGPISAGVSAEVPDALAQRFGQLSRPIIIASGRLVPQKAHKDLIDAFAALPEAQRGSLVILGEGPLRQDLQEHAVRLGLGGATWMPGFIENPWWFIARSDVFALSSHWEGFGRVLVEAMACGVPVVSTDCESGPREILSGITSARLIPVGDPSAMRDAILELLDDEIRRAAKSIKLDAYEPKRIAARFSEVVLQPRSP